MVRGFTAGVLAGLLVVLAAPAVAPAAEVAQLASPAGSVACSDCDWLSLGDRGDVVGTAKIDGQLRGVRWTNGVSTLLPPLPGHTQSNAFDVAADGAVSGTSNKGLEIRAVKWSAAGNPTDVTPTNGCSPPYDEKGSAWGRAITTGGSVFGDGYQIDPAKCSGTNYGRRAGRFDGSSSVPLWEISDRPSKPDTFLAAVSPNGDAALVDYARLDYGADIPQPPVILENGTPSSIYPCIQELGPVYNGFPSSFNDLRNSLGPNRTVVGVGANGPVSVWRNGSCDTLPLPQGTTAADAYAISSTGSIAGVIETNGELHAVVWKPDSSIVILDDLLPAGSPWKLRAAFDVNDDGWVLATGEKNGQEYPVVVKPGGITIDDVEVEQPAEGQTADATFTISLDAPANAPVGVNWATADGTAKQPADYTAASGTVTFQPGQTSKQVTVKVKPGSTPGGSGPAKRFSVNLSQASGPAAVGDPTGIATIRRPSPLKVQITTDPAKPDVKQTPGGPVTVEVKVAVTVTNTGDVPLDPVTLPDKLTVGWHGQAKVPEFPMKQTGAPESLELGPIAPGASKSATYTFELSGDGDLDIEALVLAGAGDESLHALGTKRFEPDSQLLIFNASLGARVRSQTNPELTRAGTHFLMNVTLENRSFHRKLIVDPVYAALGGNAADGHMQEADIAPTAFNPTGQASEVTPSQFVVLAPRQTREFRVIVGTSASDPFVAEGGGGGGTRAEVRFDTPHITRLFDSGDIGELDQSRVVMTNGSTEFHVGLDDSVTVPPPFGYAEAILNVGMGVVHGLYRITYGAVRGIVWDIPKAAFTGIIDIGLGSINMASRVVELWYAMKDDPGLQREFLGQVADAAFRIYTEAPQLIGDKIAETREAIMNSVQAALDKMARDWYAGDWRAALYDLSSAGTETVVNIVLIAKQLAAGLIARFPKAAAAWLAKEEAAYAKVGAALAKVKQRVGATRAVRALAGVRPGYVFKLDELAKIYGVSVKEAQTMIQIAKEKGVAIVFRSRASESIAFIEKGLAVLKPYWIKSKNVNWVDVQYLGYREAEIGKVVIRQPPLFATVKARMAKKGIKRGTPEYQAIVERYEVRYGESKGEWREMQKWHKKGKVKGKWPWEENGVDPRVQADEVADYRFKLFPENGALVPKVYVPGKGWKFITGDIDLIALTKPNGSALTDIEHVGVLKRLRSSIVGSQHPESATWVKKGQFWFKAKRNYLTNDGECCMAQVGPDGKIRAVEFNEKLSEPEKWTKLKYRIYWNGGYQVGPGQ